MNMIYEFSRYLVGGLLLTATACAQQQLTARNPAGERPVAFPGAEGFGKYTTGGRGGRIFIVSTLEDDGEGSLRKAVVSKEPGIIVFSISGTIHLLSPLNIKGNKTIAGQTAPGDGICIADHPVKLAGNNIILRYLRFRLGDRYQNRGKVPGSGHDDALSASGRKNIIIDHCSISWSTDECFSVYGGDSTTLQWNIISEPLNYSYHFEGGDADFEKHGFGGIWGGMHLSAHHNLFAHCNNRNPRFNGTRLGAQTELVDYRHNVIYNWGNNNVYGGEAGTYNIAGNYYKPGPSTHKNTTSRIVSPSRTEALPFGQFYVEGNKVHGDETVSRKNHLGVHMGNGGTEADRKKALVSQPFETIPVPVQDAGAAYLSVLDKAGASHRRDSLDLRIVKDVWNGTGRIIDVQGGHPHGTPYEQTTNAWPLLKSFEAPADKDRDGIPDEWERKNGLNPGDPSDAQQNKPGKYYTNIEVYINSLVKANY